MLDKCNSNQILICSIVSTLACCERKESNDQYEALARDSYTRIRINAFKWNFRVLSLENSRVCTRKTMFGVLLHWCAMFMHNPFPCPFRSRVDSSLDPEMICVGGYESNINLQIFFVHIVIVGYKNGLMYWYQAFQIHVIKFPTRQ